MRYRYRPAGNRTPLTHPVLGHLHWDGIYEHPDCAGHPDFEPIDEKPETGEAVQSSGDAEFQRVDEPEEDPGPGSTENPTVVASGDAPADKPPADSDADAAQGGRSTTP
jgi:hypothetical protein